MNDPIKWIAGKAPFTDYSLAQIVELIWFSQIGLIVLMTLQTMLFLGKTLVEWISRNPPPPPIDYRKNQHYHRA